MGEFKGYRWNGGEIEERKIQNREGRIALGSKIGRLTLIEFLGICQKRIVCGCICDCGKKVAVRLHKIGKSTFSCGCYARDINSLSEGESAFHDILRCYKRSAKERNLEWKISDDVFREVIVLPCIYCGSQNKNISRNRGKNGIFRYTGIDRIKNNKGYISGNIAPCCKTCNIAKHSMTIKEFREWLKRAYEYQDLGDYHVQSA